MECNVSVAEYSADFYRIRGATVRNFSGSHPVMPADMWERLSDYSKIPHIQLDGELYRPRAQNDVPANTIAIPNVTTGEKNAEPFLMKENKLREVAVR